jgi:hypothetical protein
MNVNSELKTLKAIQGKDRKVPITMMIDPNILKMIDDKCQLTRIARGDLLSACFLRVRNNAEKIGSTKELEVDHAAIARKAWGPVE